MFYEDKHTWERVINPNKIWLETEGAVGMLEVNET
jgi:hypothetical protein